VLRSYSHTTFCHPGWVHLQSAAQAVRPMGPPVQLSCKRSRFRAYSAASTLLGMRIGCSSTTRVGVLVHVNFLPPHVRSGTGPSKFRMQTEVQNANRNFIEISQKVAEIVCKFIEISPKFHGVCLRIVRAPTQRASTSKTTAATNSHHASTPKTTRGGLPKSVAPRVDFRRIDDDRRQEFPSPRKF
jgi:hypothetical protein